MSRRTLDVQFRGLDRMKRDLQVFAKKSIPFAAREVVNTAAFETQKTWREEVEKTFTLRNKWTGRSIQVTRATGLHVRTMEAKVGSVAEYMATQEKGGTVRGKGGTKAIPTEVASGQSMGTQPRSKTVRGRNYLSRLGNVPRVAPSRGRKARNARAIERAIKSGTKIAFLHLQRRKGLYRITGSKKRPVIRKLYDLTRSSVQVKSEPTLQRSLKRIGSRMPAIQRKAILQQLRRHHVFGY